MTKAQDQQYPLATPEGVSIPLEIIRATSLVSYTLVGGVPTTIAIPAGYRTVYLYATKDCVLRQDATVLPAALVDGTEYVNTMLIPANILIVAQLFSEVAQLLGLSSGKLYISAFEQWQGLNAPRQLAIG